MKILITGGAGFIGSNLVSNLVKTGVINSAKIEKIVVIDNLSLGKKEFIQESINVGLIDFYQQDLLDFSKILKIFQMYDFDLVFHLSANSDISYGFKNTDCDFKQGTLVTYNVLECMRLTGVKQIIFSSSSAIYGEALESPTSEDYGPLLPISFYGASKLACEGLISAFSNNYKIQSLIFRFSNIVGKNSTHGVLIDFINKLKKYPFKLEVLGDGKQAKPYLYVDDCIKGIIFGLSHLKNLVSYYNLTSSGTTEVNIIASMVIKAMKKENVKIEYTGGKQGWSGDVPYVRLDPKKLEKLGWSANFSSDEAITKAIDDLLEQAE